MEKSIRFIIILGVLAAALGAPAAVHAQPVFPPFCTTSSLPSHDPQYPADQLILYCIPPNWNGDLVLYAHGYAAAQAPLALPFDELYLGGSFLPEILLGQGYAFATTSYHKNGYAVEQARKDLNDLLNYFKKQVNPPGSLQKVFLVGASEGGMIVSLMIEHFPDKYAGALAMCGPVGGGPYQTRYLSDFRATFDYYFPAVFPTFGVTDVPVDRYLNWEYDKQAIAMAMLSNPAATTQLYLANPDAPFPTDPFNAITTASSILYYSIFGTNDLIATAGGMPYDNTVTLYPDPGLNAGIERVQSNGRARAYIQRFYHTTGQLQRPLVTLHNTLDPVVPYQHELIYQGMVTQAGVGNLFTPIPVPTYGHCNFTNEQIGVAFNTLVMKAAFQP